MAQTTYEVEIDETKYRWVHNHCHCLGGHCGSDELYVDGEPCGLSDNQALCEMVSGPDGEGRGHGEMSFGRRRRKPLAVRHTRVAQRRSARPSAGRTGVQFPPRVPVHGRSGPAGCIIREEPP